LRVHQQSSGFKASKPIVLTIGTFDGVHAGHLAVIDVLKRKALEINGETALLTFQPHPRVILHPKNHGLKLLTDIDERITLLDKSGLDHVIIEEFNMDLASLSPLDYVRKVLSNGIKPSVIVIGDDHRYGRNREGDFERLKEMGALFGFEVVALAAEFVNDVRVSSTKIRDAVNEGNVDYAAKLLTRPFPMSGLVVEGDKIGRTIGFPTANLEIATELKIYPANGVYVILTRVKGESKWLQGMLNIGNRPTISSNEHPTIEVHIFNFDEDCYGKTLDVLFIKRLRDELKFNSLDELKVALEYDKKAACEILDNLNLAEL
jgi:riboflavin kinase/FMN adenylyltransferase|tara:strand:- start:2078 stop:3034 length:957 start_codon:yes stop_codon:yes gene_type:complete